MCQFIGLVAHWRLYGSMPVNGGSIEMQWFSRKVVAFLLERSRQLSKQFQIRNKFRTWNFSPSENSRKNDTWIHPAFVNHSDAGIHSGSMQCLNLQRQWKFNTEKLCLFYLKNTNLCQLYKIKLNCILCARYCKASLLLVFF